VEEQMGYLDPSELMMLARMYASPLAQKSRERERRMLRAEAKARVFLSHSHQDRELAEGLTVALEMVDTDLYVDLRDYDLPNNTGPETARRLKKRIRENDRFILLLTNNTCKSAWIPWELGIADSAIGLDRVAVLPLSTFPGFDGQEFLTIYNRIENSSKDLLCFFRPGESAGIPFTWWIHHESKARDKRTLGQSRGVSSPAAQRRVRPWWKFWR
jgi:hypothetical protein